MGDEVDTRGEREIRDRSLMERVRDGDANALGVLVERYWSPLTAYAAGIVGDRDPAKDVVQDAFIMVWRKRHEWRPTGTVSAYLYRITRNLALNARRDRVTRRKKAAEASELQIPSSPPWRSDDVLQVMFVRKTVEDAIESLPERRREVFVLSRLHGLTHQEIAETLEISTQTVSNQMSAALSELRERLAVYLDEA